MISLSLLCLAFAGWLCAHKRNVPVPVWVYVALAAAVVVMANSQIGFISLPWVTE